MEHPALSLRHGAAAGRDSGRARRLPRSVAAPLLAEGQRPADARAPDRRGRRVRRECRLGRGAGTRRSGGHLTGADGARGDRQGRPGAPSGRGGRAVGVSAPLAEPRVDRRGGHTGGAGCASGRPYRRPRAAQSRGPARDAHGPCGRHRGRQVRPGGRRDRGRRGGRRALPSSRAASRSRPRAGSWHECCTPGSATVRPSSSTRG